MYTHKHLHKMPLHWRPVWLQVIVSSQAVVLVVILNDHSQRGVLTICPFKGKMIPLYRVTPEHPNTTTAAAAATVSFKLKSWDNTAFNVGALKVLGQSTCGNINSWPKYAWITLSSSGVNYYHIIHLVDKKTDNIQADTLHVVLCAIYLDFTIKVLNAFW